MLHNSSVGAATMTKEAQPIAFVIPSLAYGGAELQLINQIHAFQENGFPVFLIVLSDTIPLPRNLRLEDDKILALPSAASSLNVNAIVQTPFLISRIVAFLSDHQINVVIANLPLAHLVMRQVKIFSKLRGRSFKLINYHHSLQYKANPLNTWAKVLFNRFHSFLARVSDDTNVFVSKAAFEDVNASLFIRDPVIIYNSVPYKKETSQLAKAHFAEGKEEEAAYNIVFPGRIHPSKGHQFFLNVFADFIAENRLSAIQVKVWVVGGGDKEEELRTSVSELGLGRYTYITGFVSNDTLLSYLSWADLVVIPSIHEGFGLVAVEALMQEALVLASDAGGLKEIIRPGKNGFIFPVLDSDSLKRYLHRLLSGELQIEEKNSLAAEVRSKFSFEKQIDRLTELFK